LFFLPFSVPRHGNIVVIDAWTSIIVVPGNHNVVKYGERSRTITVVIFYCCHPENGTIFVIDGRVSYHSSLTGLGTRVPYLSLAGRKNRRSSGAVVRTRNLATTSRCARVVGESTW
jgi:hypothetical protein